MKMRFIGTNGSMGFKTNKIYKVDIKSDKRYVWILSKVNNVPYSSIKKLLDN